MASVIVAGDVSGTCTLQAPSAAGSTVLTLPVIAADTLAGIAATQTLTNKTLGAGTVMPAGSVLQVVNSVYATQSSMSNATPTDTGLTATITPRSASNTILVFVSMTGLQKNAANIRMQLQLLRGSTVIDIFEIEQLYTGAATAAGGASSTTYLDSPATTSATTYKVQVFLSVTGGTGSWCVSNCKSTITLMEIAG